MPRPCKAGNPGTALHACAKRDSKKTLCDLDVAENGVDVLAGYTSVCGVCFPADVGGDDKNEPIGGRNP